MLFTGPHPHYIPSVYCHVLAVLHPTEAKELTSMAIPSSHWREAPRHHQRRDTSWVCFENLKELVIVLDEDFERGKVERLKMSPVHDGQSWKLPEDIEAALGRIEDDHPDSGWKVPHIRLVGREDAILSDERLQMNLRCFPCDALDMNDPEHVLGI